MRTLTTRRNDNQVIASVKPNADLIRRLGKHFRAIELDVSDSITEKAVRESKRVCEGEGISIKAIHLPNLRMLRRSGSARLIRTVFGHNGRILVMHPWIEGNEQEKADMLRIARSVKLAGDRLVIENVTNPRRAFGIPSRIAAEFDRKTENVGFCLDTSHPVSVLGRNQTDRLIEFITAAGIKLGHMHLSDASESRRHLPIGDGTIDWNAFFSAVKPIYAGLYTLELKGVGIDAYRRSLDVLCRYGLEAYEEHASTLLRVVGYAEATTMLRRFEDTGIDYGELSKIVGSMQLFSYNDEKNCLFFFDSEDAHAAPLFQYSGFPKETPQVRGVFGLYADAYHTYAVYFDQERKIAVRMAMHNLLTEHRTIGDKFLEAIKTAISIAEHSEGIVRSDDGKLSV